METLVPHVRIGGRYELLQRLADDGRCSIWRATDEVLARTVIVRVFLGDVGGLAIAPARRASQVSHPNVIAIYDVGTTAEGSFVVSEPEPGASLASLVAHEGPMRPGRAARAAGGIIDGVRAAIETGVELPAIEAGAVWIDDADHVKVGLGLETVEQLSVDEGEQIRAIGAILYLALTGTNPAGEPGSIGAPRAVDPRIPRDLERVTMRATDATDDEAFGSLGSFASALTRVARATPGPDPAPEPANHHSVFRSWMLVPLAMVLVTIAVLAGGLALGKLELGGPLGVRPAPAASPTPLEKGSVDGPRLGTDVGELEVREIRSYDPFGDQTEGASSVALVADGDRNTSWATENYFDAVMTKPGVGLLLDLGHPASVEKFRLFTDAPGYTYEMRIGDKPESLARERRGETFEAQPVDRVDLAEPETGRYVLFWVTSVVPDGTGGNRASVSELTLLGRDR